MKNIAIRLSWLYLIVMTLSLCWALLDGQSQIIPLFAFIAVIAAAVYSLSTKSFLVSALIANAALLFIVITLLAVVTQMPHNIGGENKAPIELTVLLLSPLLNVIALTKVINES